jgi:hypothetical protein
MIFEPDDMLNPVQAASVLGRGVNYVRDLCNRGELPHEYCGRGTQRKHPRIRFGDLCRYARKAGIEVPKHPAIARKAAQAYRNRHPEKVRARHLANRAVKDGRLLRRLCMVCGKPAEKHHPDYADPLGVVWLCLKHHRSLHKSLGGGQ